jgi:hypothetical protein
MLRAKKAAAGRLLLGIHTDQCIASTRAPAANTNDTQVAAAVLTALFLLGAGEASGIGDAAGSVVAVGSVLLDATAVALALLAAMVAFAAFVALAVAACIITRKSRQMSSGPDTWSNAFVTGSCSWQ